MTARTRAELATQISTLLADNNTGAISEGDVRSVFTDVVDSLNAGNINIDASGFTGNLDTTDTTLQLLANALDELTLAGGGPDLSDADPETVASTAEPGTSGDASRADHIHEGSTSGIALGTDPPEDVAETASVGTGTTASPIDHAHSVSGVLSDDDPLHVGTAPDAGVAADVSRSDHVHVGDSVVSVYAFSATLADIADIAAGTVFTNYTSGLTAGELINEGSVFTVETASSRDKLVIANAGTYLVAAALIGDADVVTTGVDRGALRMRIARERSSVITALAPEGAPTYSRNQYEDFSQRLGSSLSGIFAFEAGDKIELQGLFEVQGSSTVAFDLSGTRSGIAIVAVGAGPKGDPGSGATALSDAIPETVAAAGAAGTGATGSRADHVHLGALLSSVIPVNVSTSPNSAGTATDAPRRDHRHHVPSSTATAHGIIELSTADEARAGTDNFRAMTALRVQNVFTDKASDVDPLDVGTTAIGTSTNFARSDHGHGGGGTGAGVTWQDEGTAQAGVTTVNFTGTGVTGAVSAGVLTVNIPGNVAPPVDHTNYLGISADAIFVAVDYTVSAMSVTLTVPAYTISQYISFAFPDTMTITGVYIYASGHRNTISRTNVLPDCRELLHWAGRLTLAGLALMLLQATADTYSSWCFNGNPRKFRST